MIKINIDKAKAVAHEVRRAKRAEEFAPLDEVIAKQIPGKSATEAEAERQAIRDADAALQVKINAAKTADAIKALIT